ncbi:hypothetical protein ONA91_25270 [Micromonospora sp. DR5-3]|uniref:hypothetical protein n=1 Tax=unclassified Micromonospora TaxID=2617518 RepID=UPI0011D6E384|nr:MULTISPECIES: hypothetical protein [unclassified Micromonospora]MCW3817765.1 hypothetical protein [Micromonospora sp. DR5-3]TYC20572.1 hypothetical protein FXF52_30635 [Micromonospora sp. MP36]
MSAPLWAVLATLATALLVTAGWRRRVRTRNRRELTREEKLAAARKAARQLHRSGPRPHRDTFERGAPPGDRYSGAILENSAYGDAAGHHSGYDSGGGGFDSGGSDGGSY